jgi:hypothetical protein
MAQLRKRLVRLEEELRKVFVAASFFATGFVLIIFAERLFVQGSSIHTGGIFRALVGGLIVAKVLLLVDLLPFVHAFPEKPLVHNIVWKSSLYVAASVVFTYIEPLIKGLFKGTGLSASHAKAVQELMLPRTWAIEIWLAMLLVTFVTLQELSRVIGKDEFKRIFFGHGEKFAAEKRRAA